MGPPAFGILHVRTVTDADARDCILGAVRADTAGESIDLHKTPGGQSLAATETVLSLVAFQSDFLLTELFPTLLTVNRHFRFFFGRIPSGVKDRMNFV